MLSETPSERETDIEHAALGGVKDGPRGAYVSPREDSPTHALRSPHAVRAMEREQGLTTAGDTA